MPKLILLLNQLFTELSIQRILRLVCLGLGILMIVLSLNRNWFDIPIADPLHSGNLLRATAFHQPFFQATLAVGLILLFASWLHHRSWSLLSTLVTTTMIFACLAFPYFVMLRNPILAADAIWLQIQHDNLTWLGGDIYSEAEAGMSAWKSKVYWIDAPRKISIAPLPTWDALQIGLDKIQAILIWCGYSNTFCQFARSGWFFAITGSALLGLTTLTTGRHEPQAGQMDLQRLGYGLCALTGLTTVGVVFAVWGVFASKSPLEQAALKTSQGNYEAALDYLHQCGQHFPALTQDTYFINQRAVLEFEAGYDSVYASLHKARSLESNGYYDRAFDIWIKLCESEDPAVQRESLRAVLRYAIQDYNCHRIPLAKQRLEFILEKQAGSVKVLYYLQIIGVRQQETQTVYDYCDRMSSLCEHLNFGTTKILKSVSQKNALLVARLDQNESETWFRSTKVKQP